jgi:outer membrane autotransporter protein
MNLRNGPKVSSVNYGAVVGYDTDFKELRHGWTSVGTGYVGYNGSQLHYTGTNISTNGGALGYTQTFYKGNFWSAVTLTAGAVVGESHNMYGKDDFTSLMAGVGSKTGYNFEFKEGKFIIQPSLLMSYSFINTFDYTNAAGVRIKSDPAHSVQLNPTIRLIGKTKNDWHPYASVGMVWNVFHDSNTTADGVKLPEMYMKPYVEYGVGIQKHWADKFNAYGQVMLRGGGRNGVALSAGFRWAIGKDPAKVHKEQNVQNVQKIKDNQKVQNVKDVKNFNSSAKTIATNEIPTTSTSLSGRKAVIKQLPRK